MCYEQLKFFSSTMWLSKSSCLTVHVFILVMLSVRKTLLSKYLHGIEMEAQSIIIYHIYMEKWNWNWNGCSKAPRWGSGRMYLRIDIFCHLVSHLILWTMVKAFHSEKNRRYLHNLWSCSNAIKPPHKKLTCSFPSVSLYKKLCAATFKCINCWGGMERCIFPSAMKPDVPSVF